MTSSSATVNYAAASPSFDLSADATNTISATIDTSGNYNAILIQVIDSLANTTTVFNDDSINATTCTIDNLDTLSAYSFLITPFDDAGLAGTVTTLPFAFSPHNDTPTLSSFQAQLATPHAVRLQWTGSNYHKVSIFVSQSPFSTFYAVASATGTPSIVIDNLVQNTTYQFYALPYNSRGNAGFASNVLSVTTDYFPNIHLDLSGSSILLLSGSFHHANLQTSADNALSWTTFAAVAQTTLFDAANIITTTTTTSTTPFRVRAVPFSPRNFRGLASNTLSL